MIGIIIATVVAVVAVAALIPKPQVPQQDLAGIDDLDFPTAEAGREISVLFGTKEIQAPNVVWYGDFSAWRAGGDNQYPQYAIGCHMVLCHGPIDSILSIRVDKKLFDNTPINKQANWHRYYKDQGGLFGGRKNEGGIRGWMSVGFGEETQTQNSYLVNQLGTSDITAYRGVVSFILEGCYIGTAAYMKPWSFLCKRIDTRSNGLTQWYSEKAAINTYDMNPAHIIRECLTDPVFGMGYPENDIDNSSFTQAADTLFDEGMGMSLLWTSQTEIDSFVSMIIEHIDGFLYVDPKTGLFTLKLARDNYDVETLPVVDESSIDRITNLKRPSSTELINQVTVKFWNFKTLENDSFTVQDIALIAQQSYTNGTTIDYRGFTNDALVTRIASRDLRALSTPLASCNIYANRTVSDLQVGDPFILSYAKKGIINAVFRVVGIEYGDIESNIIKFEVVQDVFAFSNAVYAPPPGSDWVNPANPPEPVTTALIEESSYYDLQRKQWPDATLLIAGAAPTQDASLADILSKRTQAEFADVGDMQFSPSAVLQSPIDKLQTVLPMANFSAVISNENLPIVGTYAQLNGEKMLITAMDETTVTVERAVVDSVPQTHAVNSVMLFLNGYCYSDSWQYSNGDTAEVKLLPITGEGQLDESLAPVEVATFDSRAERPYPPAAVRINGEYWPSLVTGSLAVSWRRRNRVSQGTTLRDWYGPDIAPEAGTTYTVQVLQGMTVLDEVIGSTNTSETLNPGTDGLLTVKVWAERDGLQSMLTVEHTFQYYRTEPLTAENGETLLTESGEEFVTE